MSEKSKADRRPPVETDARFPSGPWKGFWLQRGLSGRQWMRLVMQFSENRIIGEGRDGVGPFVIRGSYDLTSGHCSLIKTYPASHDVVYSGANEGDGKWLWGVWKIATETGGFHLWPSDQDDPTSPAKKAAEPLPPMRKRRPALLPV